MRTKWLLTISGVLVLAVVTLASCTADGTVATTGGIDKLSLNSQQEGIWVTGQGEVTVVPDIATVSLGIEAQEASVAQAQSKATQAMNDVMTALTGNGVAEKDIRTQFFNIQKVTRFDNDKQQEIVIGYRVTNVVAAKIRDIDKAGTIIDAVATAGGDLTRIDNIQFSVDDPSTYYGQAREKAMTDARDKAKQLADLAGVSLGNPTFISESAQFPSIIPSVAFAREAVFAETPISPGETEITLSIQVVYNIR